MRIFSSPANGQTWSDPIDIRQFGVNSGPTVLGFGNCMGVLGDKLFLAADMKDIGRAAAYLQKVVK